MFVHDLGDGAWLEKVETRHAGALFALIARHRALLDGLSAIPPEVPGTEAGFRDWIAGERDLEARDLAVTCGIWQGGEPVGVAALRGIDAHALSGAMWGFVDPERQSRGVGTRATRAIVSYGLRTLGLERVEWRCQVDNAPIRQLAARLGMRCEGRLRSSTVVGDEFLDLLVYSALGREWDETCRRVEEVRARPEEPRDRAWMRALDPHGPRRSAGERVRVVEGRGFVRLRLGPSDVGEIVRIAVAREAAGRHVGHRLFEVAQAELHLLGARQLVTVVDDRAPAHHRAFLTRRGMRRVADGLWAVGLA